MPSSSRRSQQPASPWQERLEEVCHEYQFQAPEYQIVSDRRGGRTAWSSVVVVYGTRIQARYWYDGNNVNNAREDAAEAAITWLIANVGVSSTR